MADTEIDPFERLRERCAEEYPGAWERITAFITAWNSYAPVIQDAQGVELFYDDLLTVLNMKLFAAAEGE